MQTENSINTERTAADRAGYVYFILSPRPPACEDWFFNYGSQPICRSGCVARTTEADRVFPRVNAN
jgi:hypothetical protein